MADPPADSHDTPSLNKNRRITMIKHTVGKVRTSAYALPGNDYVYGIESKIDKEGAGAVLQSWANSEPSKPSSSMQSFPVTNRQALRDGNLTSKGMREYAKRFPVTKQKSNLYNKRQNEISDSASCTIDRNQIFHTDGSITSPHGLPAQQPTQSTEIRSKKSSISMTDLLRSTPAELKEETDYPDLSKKKRKGRLPPAKSTKSSRLVHQCRLLPTGDALEAQNKVKEFKMKKFLKAKSKVKAYIESA